MKSSFLLIGPTGSGKTTQFRTLPGPRFAYLFDPHAHTALRGCEYDMAEFYPEPGELDIFPRSVRKDSAIKRSKGHEKWPEPTTYDRWCDDINRRHAEGFFQNYETVMLDSVTTFGKALMDITQYLQDLVRSEDARTDYQLAGTRMANAFRQLMTLPCNILLCAHNEMNKDDNTGRLFKRILMPGSARQVVPLLTEHVLIASVDHSTRDDKTTYYFQTKPDRENPICRTSLRDMPFQWDATIQDFQKPERYGLGALLKQSEKEL